MKYILTIVFAFFIFTGNVKAAPLHAYYCFNALETANNVVSAFDGFLNSPSSEGMSTHRLYAFPLNGENNITHCMVAEHSGPDQFEKNNNIVNGSASGTVTLSSASTIGDVINLINNSGLNVTASINSAGNSLQSSSNSASSVAVFKNVGTDEFDQNVALPSYASIRKLWSSRSSR